MNVFRTLTSNYIVNAGIVSFCAAQVLKLLFTLLITRRIVLERLTGAGGMPSSHSALTCAIAIALARKLGYDSPEFGLALAFAVIVMYDAMGVRRAAGEQAKALNKMIFEFPFFRQKMNLDSDDATQPGEETPLVSKEFKELLGHTPFEVLGGCLVGILVAMLMPVG